MMAYQHWLPDSDEFWEQELGALKPLETQKLQPVSMGLPRHQGGTLAHSFGTLTAHKRAMVEENCNKSRYWGPS